MNKREIDALVAEHIFGHKVCDMEIGADEGECKHYGDQDHFAKNDPLIPHYTTDRALALEVAEKALGKFYLSREELYESVDGASQRSDRPGYAVYTNLYKVEEGDPIAQADTAPMALCLAALRTKGVDV